ncbi:hypothetical protein PYCCODRAFT_422790 [Trametes coccinea BRFM310]|uniref:Peptidase A1 domain-containing protein n=1 Tax=Trametes coccinea (strain BRFM310) TaxID=1353009 RepID=A0A1Y2IPX3_TRAC3|nr:hypothetical protein PYCCODRAFT_422790 [Trametes coccinea BRFM310]
MQSSSFALKAGLPSVKPDDEEPEDTPAVVTYVMLRDSEAGSDLFSQESCIAWQQYPLIGDEPSARVFSEKIYVSPTSTLWLVVLKKIRIWTGIHLKSKGDESGHAPATEIDCGSQQFVLDTGAACSYFPMKLRNQLIDKLQLTRIASGDSWRKPYCVPLSADGTDRFSYRNSTMEWVFHSEGHAPVTVPTTVRPFLMDNNRDGVIWDLPSEDNPTTTAAQSPIGILGQNFFYVADVAFHTPDPSYGAGRRYIKIAGSSSHRTLPPTRSRAEVAYSSAKKDALPGRPN